MEDPRPAIVHVVDDDEAVRDSTRALLESHGMVVRTYQSGPEFLLADGGTTGCLLLDLHMPGMSGLEVLDRLHTRGSRMPVVAMTGRSDAVLKQRATKGGALMFLDKPVTEDALLQSVSCALTASGSAPHT